MVPRGSHAGWEPPADRRDPVDVLTAQAETRVPDLVPIRYGRMLVSPFAFYRGAAAIMAEDLARTPNHRDRHAAVRRRAPVQLRRVRHARARPGVRAERLRRDAARALGVGRQAARREHGDRRPGPRLSAKEPGRSPWPRPASTAAPCASTPSCRISSCGTADRVVRHARPLPRGAGRARRAGARLRRVEGDDQGPGCGPSASSPAAWTASCGSSRSAAAGADRGARPATRSSTTSRPSSRASCGRTGAPSRRTAGGWSTRTATSTWPARWSASAASAPEHGWC